MIAKLMKLTYISALNRTTTNVFFNYGDRLQDTRKKFKSFKRGRFVQSEDAVILARLQAMMRGLEFSSEDGINLTLELRNLKDAKRKSKSVLNVIEFTCIVISFPSSLPPQKIVTLPESFSARTSAVPCSTTGVRWTFTTASCAWPA